MTTIRDMNLLLPYIRLRDHPDPDLNEFTYGDIGRRGRSLHRNLKQGDYVFFHTSRDGKKFVTAYFVVDRVLASAAACKDKAIVAKHRNPHITRSVANGGRAPNEDDYVVFGDPIRSRLLPRPLPFDKNLAKKLSLGIRFGKGMTDTQAIGSATRAWRELTDVDRETLLVAIRREERQPRHKSLMTTEEVAETIEKDVEDYLAANPALIGKGLRLAGRQVEIAAGRIDLLFESRRGDQVVVEVKLGRIGRDAISQVQSYLNELRHGSRNSVQGVIVCSGIMPAYESDLQKQRKIRILRYGWDLKTEPME